MKLLQKRKVTFSVDVLAVVHVAFACGGGQGMGYRETGGGNRGEGFGSGEILEGRIGTLKFHTLPVCL